MIPGDERRDDDDISAKLPWVDSSVNETKMKNVELRSGGDYENRSLDCTQQSVHYCHSIPTRIFFSWKEISKLARAFHTKNMRIPKRSRGENFACLQMLKRRQLLASAFERGNFQLCQVMNLYRSLEEESWTHFTLDVDVCLDVGSFFCQELHKPTTSHPKKWKAKKSKQASVKFRK